ncbi:tetratricopeptide repeat protein [uncultured Winogradskyella sp.]|uniref:tetratricopeptide repeat protein n=1 Tax=uncultured Winogradskyella sp. TaxID=395353 RepID=UPI0026169677|nr:tetratricopeptide repeat protein [uncultured Winogradskyella sp.]|tara:strand:+ start:130 stop:972 length:843 start_codon:yes stop_codon:yes gene_type:complete
MKLYLSLIALLVGFFGFSQDQNEAQLKAEKNATDFVYQANELVSEDNYVEAEMAYRKAISKAPSKAVGAYNLAHSYYKKGSFDEALFRSQEAAKNATNKIEKHRAFHNMGNILMESKQCKEAVEAYKNALRSNPNDEETRYNLAIAKDCANQQEDGGGEEDKKDENKDQEQDKEDDQKKEDDNKDNKDNKDKKDEGDQDKKDGDQEKDDEGKPKDDKKDDGKGDKDNKDKNQKQKPKPGQMSPQQVKNILEAMQNQEQKVQEKMNAEKQKGVKVKTEKDW